MHKAILGCNPISDRLITIELQGHPMNMTIFQVYAPTSTADPEEIECFYAELQTHINNVPGQDILIIMGDWNAKVGEIFETEKTSRFVLGERNEAGTRLIDFCIENELVITSTLFE